MNLTPEMRWAIERDIAHAALTGTRAVWKKLVRKSELDPHLLMRAWVRAAVLLHLEGQPARKRFSEIRAVIDAVEREMGFHAPPPDAAAPGGNELTKGT